jgi:hypothetical protein
VAYPLFFCPIFLTFLLLVSRWVNFHLIRFHFQFQSGTRLNFIAFPTRRCSTRWRNILNRARLHFNLHKLKYQIKLRETTGVFGFSASRKSERDKRSKSLCDPPFYKQLCFEYYVRSKLVDEIKTGEKKTLHNRTPPRCQQWKIMWSELSVSSCGSRLHPILPNVSLEGGNGLKWRLATRKSDTFSASVSSLPLGGGNMSFALMW